jgi:1-acyl-sn-glycerol-3-phosphate acyltransferase
VLAGTATIVLLFRFYSKARREQSVTIWSRKLLRILDVRVRSRGMRPRSASRPLMLVANHVSWLDIHVLHALTPARFVAKSDMLAWPLIGRLAEAAGTLFVDRARRRDAARINEHIVDAFRHGDCVGIFPEGTTTHGDHLRKFHGSLLQPAIQHEAMLIPVALRYLGDGGGIDRAVGYVGKTTLLQSFLAVLTRPTIRVRVAFLSPIEAAGHSRRDLARCAEFAIADSLKIPISNMPPELPVAQAGAMPSSSVPTGIRCL